jgi:hypothetical protein
MAGPLGLAEEAAEVAMPGLKIGKWIVVGIVALILAGLAGWVIWKLFFAQHAAEQKSAIVQAQGQGEIDKAGALAGQDAVPIIVKNYNTGAAIDAKTQEAIRDILKAQGAAQAIDPAVADLGRRAICLRTSAAGLLECQHLFEPDTGGLVHDGDSQPSPAAERR